MKGSQSLSLHFDVDRQMAYSEMDTNRKYDWLKTGQDIFEKVFDFVICKSLYSMLISMW